MADPARDQRLADLLSELTEQRHRGQRPDLDGIAREHPDLASELRGLWAAVQIAEEIGKSAFQEATLAWAPAAPSAAPTVSLPRSFGDYELLEELGRGGMGVVYKARQKSLDRVVAVKTILRGELASPADVARFRAEAEAAARLEHANIVSVYEVGECGGEPFFGMQYVEGQSLAALLTGGPTPPRDAARYMVAVARAVQSAHEGGILHRDLKPSNVLLDRDGRPHVTDFGLAKRVQRKVQGGERDAEGTARSALQALTQTGAIVGTPSYMSPEQAAGSRGTVGPVSDVYSLGAILYELITGRPPFQAASAVDTLLLVLEQDPLPPRLLNPQVDRELEMICLKCLQKPADLRYPSAGKLADDLEAFLEGEPISARSGNIAYVVGRLFRETHHAAVLENWGLLWMWHSLALVVLCALTSALAWQNVDSVLPYLALWTAGMGAWAAIFWAMRRRSGPVTFIERQIAHVWAASVIGSASMFAVEFLLRLPVLTLAPVLAVLAGMVFLVKAGMLSGSFYFAAAACFLTAIVMALLPSRPLQILVFGVVSATCFFLFGLKYHRQRARSGRLDQ